MSTNFPDDPDGQALAGLVDAGLDLKIPHDVEFSTFAADEETASRAAASAADLGFVPDVFFDEASSSWSVYLKKNMILDYRGVIAAQELLNDRLKPFSMACDGWQVAIDMIH